MTQQETKASHSESSSQPTGDTENKRSDTQHANEQNVEVAMTESQDKDDKKVFKIIKLLSFLILALLIWQVVADRLTPYSSDVRIRGFVVPISSQVDGQITSVNVVNNQPINRGDVLFEVDQATYQLAVDQARAELDNVAQEIGADVAAVASAQARLVNARSVLDYAKQQSKRLLELVDKGVLARAEGDKVETQLEQAKGDVRDAEANLVEAKQKLGERGRNNPRIRSSESKLRDALLDLERSKVIAPSNGGVTNLSVDVGHYAKAGSPLMTFVSTRLVWVEAYMRENSIENIKPGDQVEITLDVAPGRIFKGSVISTGFGINWGQTTNPGELPQIKATKTWLRDPQRFPVMIKFDDEMPKGTRRVGGQADVIIYTGDNPIMNSLGWCIIRIMSFLSYLN